MNKLRLWFSFLNLAALLWIAGVYFGARSIYVNDNSNKVKQGFLHELSITLVKTPSYVYRILTDTDYLYYVDCVKLKKLEDTEVGYLGEQPLPIDKDIIYSDFDYIQDTSKVIWLDFKTNTPVKEWALPFELIKRKNTIWVKNHPDQSWFTSPEAYENDMLKAPLLCPRLYTDSSVLVNMAYPSGVARISKENEILWYSEEMSHHSIEVDHDKNIWFCSSRKLPGFEDIIDDEIVKINGAGETLFKKSVFKLLSSIPDIPIQYNIAPKAKAGRDPFHLNDVQPVLKDSERGFWKKGDVFISLRNVNMILLYRPAEDSVLWWKSSPWKKQHDVDIVNDSVISIFDNNSGVWRDTSRGSSPYFYDFARDTAYIAFDFIFEENNLYTPTQGRFKYYPTDSLVYVESSDQGVMVVYDIKRSTYYKLAVQSKIEGYAEPAYWFTLLN